MGKYDYITMKGLVRLKERLDHLNNVERPEVVRQVVTAREMGDLSENAEYHAARERQRMIDKELGNIRNRINILKIIDPDTLPKDAVRFGAVVTVREDGEIKTYRIVGIDETGFMDDDVLSISLQSPIGSGLLGAKPGQTLTVAVPKGDIKLEIIEIK